MSLRKYLVCPALILSLLFGAASAVHAADAEVLKRVIKNGQIRVGMTGNQPPMNVKSRTGAFIGLEVDLANVMAKALGVRLMMVPKPFPELLAALKNGEVDMVMSNMSITPERTLMVSFVGPYMLSGRSILTRSSLLARASSPADLNRPDIKVAAIANSTGQRLAEQYLPNTRLITTWDYDDAIRILKKGEVDVVIADMTVCKLAVMKNPDDNLLTLASPLNIEPVGIAISREDLQFQNLISNLLNGIEDTGILDQLRKKWLEDDSWISSLP
ncbi:MAG: transporter substrate-binding domain-containing protein [Xanthomonadales bacterium]|nr:transporter substrate-binding domain-containing protein [Xanthomonadales bacterium]